MTAQTPRKYSSRSQQTTLSGLFVSSATIMPVVSGTALLGGIAAPTAGQTFTVVIDPDTSLEEIVDVTGVSGNNFTVTRAIDGSTAQDHSAGAVVRHMVIGRDLREANTHEVATSGVHGLTGNVVGDTDTQVITNKDLSSATNTLSTSVVTLTGSQTLTNKTLTSPTINGGTVSSSTVTSATIASGTLGSALAAGGYQIHNMADPSSAQDAATKNYVDAQITNLVNGAPVSLNQLNELASAINNDPNFNTTLNTALGTKLPLAGGTMTGAINMGTHQINNLSTPTASTDATNKSYVDGILGSATAASTSAASAATSASSALVSQTAAATSATSAAASATAAATSATSAAASATAAATSAASAATSASTATTQAAAASTSASSAATSATSSATSASAALTSANSASLSQTAAATSATSAAASATAAATSATSAAASATSASNYATNAATSAASSLTTYNVYKQYYLGTFATTPTLDNQGNALINGATYFNSANNTMFVYSTSTTTWSAISSTSSVTNVLGTAGNITSTGGTAPTINLATAGTAGTYGHPSTITTDAYGRITSATTGTVTGSGNYVLQTNPTLTLPTIGNAVFGFTNVPVSGGTTNLSSSDNQQIYFTANGSNSSHTVVLPNTATLAVGEYFDLTNITHLGTNANVAINVYGGTSLATMYPSQSVVATVLSTSSNTSGAWNIFYDGSSTATGTSAAVFSTGPSLANPSLANATLTGTLTAGGGVGTSGYYLQTTGTGVQWSAVSSYTAPTIGTTSIGSGATVPSIAGLTSLALNYTGASTNVGALSIGGATSISDTGLMATFVGNSATYAYQLTQNTSSGASSYTTITAANNGYASYVSVGVNSTTYNYATAGYPNNAFSLPSANFIEADNGDLVVGTWTNNPIHFVVNGVAATTDVMTMTSSLVSTTVPITATKHQQLDGAGRVIDIALMGIMGAW